MLLTSETGATRAFACVLQRSTQIAVAWLNSVGLPATTVNDVHVEEQSVGGSRRADIVLQVTTDDGVAKTIVEAKIDAPADPGQLADAATDADYVIALLPDGIDASPPDGVVPATWEDALELLRSGPGADSVSAFLAGEISHLLRSAIIEARRQLTQLQPPPLPTGWSSSGDSRTSGGDLFTLTGPPRPGQRWISIEVSNRSYGSATPLRAHVMVCTRVSNVDPVVWAVLGAAASCWPIGQFTNVTFGDGGTRTPGENQVAGNHAVPRSWRYGYGEKQYHQKGWSGFGPRLELTGEDPGHLLEAALAIAVELDAELSTAPAADS